MATILVMVAIGAWAVLSGQISYIVTSGTSMNPVYYQNDLVFVAKAGSYHIGDIAAYHGPGTVRVLHRIIGGDAETGFLLKGDNNQSTDAIKPTAGQVIGQAVLHVPKGGIWLKPLLSPAGLGMIGFLIVSSGAAARTRREIPRGRRKKRVKAMARQGGSWATAMGVAKAVQRLPPYLQAATALVALVAGAALTLGVLGWMKPAAERKTFGNERSMTYSYSAPVPKSAAYDGTVAGSPDPIFRKLADHVDLRMRYAGPPGTIAVDAVLANDAGWHTTMRLIPAKKFTGPTFDATTGLDLDAMEDRAKAAATAIGMQAGPVKVTVTAQVTGEGGTAFDAPVTFTLAPLQFQLVGGASALTVTDTSGTSTRMVLRTIGPLPAGTARLWAAFLMLAALAGAVLLFALARRKTPMHTRVEIERRYSQLLVQVEPMASPPGKPVVNVDNFPALVRLAERYGQMILTWTRQDADDFVVRDEGITYRYRIPFEEPTLQNVELIDRPGNAGSHRRKASSQVS